MQKIDLEKDPLGLGKLIKRLGVNVANQLIIAGRGVRDDIVGQGRLRAPIDRGDLRRSINAEGDYAIVEAGGQKIEFSIRAAAEYAAIQHENETFEHPKGGEAKYLSGPAEERKDMHMEFIAKAIRRAMIQTAAGS